MPQSPRYANNGDAEEQPAREVQSGNLPPAKKYPDKIHHRRQASGFTRPVYKFMAEWPQSVSAQLEELHTEGDANDGDAHQQSHDILDEGDDYAAKQKPEYIAKELHGVSL